KLSRFFTRPIKRLTEGVEDIRSGNYQVRLPVRSQDELGRLTQSFNEMARVIGLQKEGLESYAGDLEKSYLSTIRILAASLDARDNYTLGHSARVARLALLIGRHHGLTEKELKELEMACFLHDIGKIRIPDEVLNKDAPLDAEER
ncbi:MAG: HAMP domain-containing protein, partial [Desulfuromonadales bacterium]|nr:HAMP domain-containing protein [Desulfuromonadales bacterium]NIR33920.1 HAMP domain-containing protein [Desulfuromonadales bacterium]NIS43918.1 HAMP domain-containing protein [Desulfuromonadales bacterium]